MDMRKIVFFLTGCLVFSLQVAAQVPVKYQLVKLANTILLPPATAQEAYSKSLVNGAVDQEKFFRPFYDRMEGIGKELGRQTGAQQSAGGLAAQTGVSPEMMALAEKMQDPAFQKKFEAMSDAEKAKIVMAAQQPAGQSQHTQKGLKLAMEASQLADQFMRNYHRGGLENFGKDLREKSLQLDQQEALELKPVLAEKERLQKHFGAGTTAAESQRLKELRAKEWAIRDKAFERKLALYRSSVLDYSNRYTLSVKPFDDFMLRISYGDGLRGAKDAAELAKIAGYQEGLLREIVRIQDIAKDITLAAVQFYQDKLSAGQ
jgi:hypothetical protein